MSNKNWLTVLIGGLLTVAPQIVGFLPSEVRDVGTAVIGVAIAAWHLYQPVPSAK